MAQLFDALHVGGRSGNSVGDAICPRQCRYTEVRMSKLAHELLADIDKRNCDFVANYDESETEPTVWPARFPNLLVHGQTGIAVGMATNIPPHNLGEIIDACVAPHRQSGHHIAQLMQIVPGPDFPTAGLITARQEIRFWRMPPAVAAFHPRSRTNIEED